MKGNGVNVIRILMVHNEEVQVCSKECSGGIRVVGTRGLVKRYEQLWMKMLTGTGNRRLGGVLVFAMTIKMTDGGGGSVLVVFRDKLRSEKRKKFGERLTMGGTDE